MSQQLYTSAEIAAMTVANLKQALRNHGQSVAGKKTALVADESGGRPDGQSTPTATGIND